MCNSSFNFIFREFPVLSNWKEIVSLSNLMLNFELDIYCSFVALACVNENLDINNSSTAL